MKSDFSAVMVRRGELLGRIASQREQMCEIGMRFQTSLVWAERGGAVMRFIRANSVLVTGAFIAVLVVRPRWIVGTASAALRLWKGYRDFTAIALKH